MKEINNTNIIEWLTGVLEQMFTNSHFDYASIENPFVTHWKTARPTIKYFENRPFNQRNHCGVFFINFKNINKHNVRDIIEILNDHGNGFWTLDLICEYLVKQLLVGSDDYIQWPFNDYDKLLITTARNDITLSQLQDLN